jgi:CheY-like chemotaxis protein
MKILIIDDSEIDISIINAAISKVEGVTTRFAKNADSAIRMAIIEKPDLIILDVVMSSMDGIELKSRLSRTLDTSDIPVIFVTAGTDSSERDCYRVGCVEYLTKPLDMAKLVTIITRQAFITKLENLMESNRKLAKKLCA